ncbi:hypothetical protein LTSEBAI_2685, partial [Salmonella enterica subsp. enterica serovar Baildon str. R6-199]
MRAYGPHRMRNISEYIYEISGVKLIAGFPSATVAILATFFTRFRCTLWVVFKVPTAMLAAFTTCF